MESGSPPPNHHTTSLIRLPATGPQDNCQKKRATKRTVYSSGASGGCLHWGASFMVEKAHFAARREGSGEKKQQSKIAPPLCRPQKHCMIYGRGKINKMMQKQLLPGVVPSRAAVQAFSGDFRELGLYVLPFAQEKGNTSTILTPTLSWHNPAKLFMFNCFVRQTFYVFIPLALSVKRAQPIIPGFDQFTQEITGINLQF